ncbi:phosphatidate cytidylyltransferase 2-like [Amphiura filiformis]|uniref:phosphatidate cytidylyltransferase 2-like n=1 Tax=Amphiura filiformis TaxID=82378 RepID=UPI003B217C1E
MSELRHREGHGVEKAEDEVKNEEPAAPKSSPSRSQPAANQAQQLQPDQPVENEKPSDQTADGETKEKPAPLPDIQEPPIPAQKDVIPEVLKGLSPRWQNWIIRGVFTWAMIFGYAFLIYMGPVALASLIILIEMMCFHEIIRIGHAVYKSEGLPWFRTLSWYFLLSANYFVYGQSLQDYFGIVLRRELEFLQPFIDYYRFISFCMYMFGFILFVLSLKKSHYLVQFTLFGWTHIALLIVVTQSNLIVQSLFEGLIWFITSTMSVICNDIMAYMFGFFFGRTRLIKLSPKKTWEGFIGGGFATVLFSVFLVRLLAPYQLFSCPALFDDETHTFKMECQASYIFIDKEYTIPGFIQVILSLVGLNWTTVIMMPAQIHAFVIGLFASLVSPFGGFFASGFKRAFKIKDFGDVIPGHGGIMDRFDCQFLMASFLYVYINTFIKTPNPSKLVQQVLNLSPENQVAVYTQLTEVLTKRGLIPITPP